MNAMPTENTSSNEHALYMVKGMLTKFMRMLFPVEFRLDSLPNTGAILPFHYPLMPGEMIYLPETVSSVGGAAMARDYYVLTAAHLAGRHEFGTFGFRLADMPGFEDRAEVGLEAIDSYVSSFEDPALAGALLRLCESTRVDAELCAPLSRSRTPHDADACDAGRRAASRGAQHDAGQGLARTDRRCGRRSGRRVYSKGRRVLRPAAGGRRRRQAKRAAYRRDVRMAARADRRGSRGRQ